MDYHAFFGAIANFYDVYLKAALHAAVYLIVFGLGVSRARGWFSERRKIRRLSENEDLLPRPATRDHVEAASARVLAAVMPVLDDIRQGAKEATEHVLAAISPKAEPAPPPLVSALRALLDQFSGEVVEQKEPPAGDNRTEAALEIPSNPEPSGGEPAP